MKTFKELNGKEFGVTLGHGLELTASCWTDDEELLGETAWFGIRSSWCEDGIGRFPDDETLEACEELRRMVEKEVGGAWFVNTEHNTIWQSSFEVKVTNNRFGCKSFRVRNDMAELPNWHYFSEEYETMDEAVKAVLGHPTIAELIWEKSHERAYNKAIKVGRVDEDGEVDEKYVEMLTSKYLAEVEERLRHGGDWEHDGVEYRVVLVNAEY